MDLKTHLTTRKIAALVVAILVVIGMSRGCGSEKPRYSAADQQKLDALNDAFKNGLLTQDEYKEKLKELNASAEADSADSDDDDNRDKGGAKTSGGTKMAEITDPAWGIVAYRIEIPADWKFEGTILRNDECGFPETFTWRLSSPDGLYGAQYIPEFESKWSNSDSFIASYNQHHCKSQQPLNASELLQYMVPFVRANPTIGEIEDTEDAAAYQDRANQDSQKIYGNNGQISGTAVQSRIKYDFHGQTLEEEITVHLRTVQRRVPPYVGPTQFFEWTSNGVIVGIRSPEGQLDKTIEKVKSILSKGAITDEWRKRSFQKIHDDQARIMQWSVQQREATFQSIEASHAAFMQAQQERFDRQNERIEGQLEAMHRSAQAYVLYASDEQLFRNNDTGEVIRAPIQYGDHAWQDPISRNILLTDNPDVNPGLFERARWSQLEHVTPMNVDQ
jgi:hypothetical protein